MSGAILLKPGEDVMIRGPRNILFHFDQPDLEGLSFDKMARTFSQAFPHPCPSTPGRLVVLKAVSPTALPSSCATSCEAGGAIQ